MNSSELNGDHRPIIMPVPCDALLLDFEDSDGLEDWAEEYFGASISARLVEMEDESGAYIELDPFREWSAKEEVLLRALYEKYDAEKSHPFETEFQSGTEIVLPYCVTLGILNEIYAGNGGPAQVDEYRYNKDDGTIILRQSEQ